MPFGDRTGPAGLGPMTGRAAGYCAGYGVPGSLRPAPPAPGCSVPGFTNPMPGRFGFAAQRAGYAYPVAAGYGSVPYTPYAGYPPFFGWGGGGRGGRGRGRGRGFGRGRGRGFGRGRRFGSGWRSAGSVPRH